MAYFEPYIDESGFHYPSYQDILNDILDGMRKIYGQDLYLEHDSQDYQMCSIFALKYMMHIKLQHWLIIIEVLRQRLVPRLILW